MTGECHLPAAGSVTDHDAGDGRPPQRRKVTAAPPLRALWAEKWRFCVMCR
ncbi:hypothetical protein GCM10009677_38460 [Sphaerisporangium rubeum]